MKIKLFIALFFISSLNCAENSQQKTGWLEFGKSKFFEYYNKLTPTQKKVAVVGAAGATTAVAIVFAKKYLEENPQALQHSYDKVKGFVEKNPKAVKIIGGAILVGAAIYFGKKLYDNYQENKKQEAGNLFKALIASLTAQQKIALKNNSISRVTPRILLEEKYFNILTETQKTQLKTIATLLS